MQNPKTGFTLIELLVVISLIGLLSAVFFLSFKEAKQKAETLPPIQWATSLHRLLGADAVGGWHFDEGMGATTTDVSGYANHGTFVGNPKWVKETPSGQGWALLFTGAQYVELGNPTSLQIKKDQTISLWLYPTLFSGRRNPYAKATGGEGTITQEANGRVSYYYGACGGDCSPNQRFIMTDNLQLNTWTHLAIVRDLFNMRLYWYKNGNLVDQTNASYSSAVTSNLSARIGSGPNGYYYGIIDDVRVYSRALPLSEIQKIYVEGLEKLKLAKE